MTAETSPFLEIPLSDWLASNRSAFAIKDRFPVSPGHCLVVPRRLISHWWEASSDEKVDLWNLVDQVKQVIDASHRPDGYNVGFNAGAAAGQTVDHLHLHVIPRYHGDTPDPRGGVRLAIPSRGNYLATTVDQPDELDLFDATKERYLLAELHRCLTNIGYDRIDLIVSFIMRSGLDLIEDHLADALERGARVRVITTDYMNVTDHRALARLLDLRDNYGSAIETRVFRSSGVSFHPKSYIFWSSTSRLAAGFVGSSNLSAAGIDGGVEWNVGTRDVARLRASFDGVWDDPRCEPLEAGFLDSYRRHVSTAPSPGLEDVVDEPEPQPVAPRPIQREALTALEATRSAGYTGGLVTLATGLGKTWLAAFDSSRPQFSRVLFIAHREEILTQSRDVFRQVRADASLGLFHGPEKRPAAQIVFASIQTLSQRLTDFEADEFDYIVIDEFHHAAAPTYRTVIDYFRPKFLLGLTATPRRMDGADLLALCHDNLVYECSLVEGILRRELVPFQYWGVRDTVDFEPIPWRNGRFDPQQLTEALETRERAEQAYQEWAQRRGARTLAFCCSITHADFMKEFFTAKGARAATVHSSPTSDPRRETVHRLRAGALDVIFSIDVFNEGFDAPEVDTILLLRPTDSPVIFLQQIGRGLRTNDEKDHLRVIDFIGNHRSFLTRPRVLLSLGSRATPSDIAVLRAVNDGSFELPPGCSVSYDLDVIELFKHMVKQSGTSGIEEYCRRYFDDEGVRPSAAQVFQAGFNPAALRARHGGWHGFLGDIGLLEQPQSRVWSLHSDVLRSFETESINKSYKLVALRALLRDGTLRTGTTVSGVSSTSRSILLGDPRLIADVRTDELPDPATADAHAWERWWRKWPLTHLAGDHPGALFRIAGEIAERFEPTFAVDVDNANAFDSMVAEIVEWRLQRYLLDKSPPESTDAVLKLTHAGGKPILMLDRGKHPDLPEGEVEFLANGDRYLGRFVKVAMNVATRAGEPGNALPTLLRGWFGPAAGHPGTAHRVRLRQENGFWVLAPQQLESIDGNSSAVPLFADYAVACGAFGATDLATYGAGRLQILGEGDHDGAKEFVVFARGDSMDGGEQPIRHGDPLLFEWAGTQSAGELVGQRVLVEQRDGGPVTSALKELGRTASGFELRSAHVDYPTIHADASMRVVARLIRPLAQSDVNPLAGRIGDRLIRREAGALYCMEHNPQFQQSGYSTNGTDAVLLVTLNKEAMSTGQHYIDAFESPDIFTWSSQSATAPESKRGREVLDALATGIRLHLWVRPDKKTREFEYCGLVAPISHEGTKPMQVRFRLLTPLTEVAWARLGSFESEQTSKQTGLGGNE
ncbi:MAG: hypothetical protein RL238_726 [Actinomycetota bacterium]